MDKERDFDVSFDNLSDDVFSDNNKASLDELSNSDTSIVENDFTEEDKNNMVDIIESVLSDDEEENLVSDDIKEELKNDDVEETKVLENPSFSMVDFNGNEYYGFNNNEKVVDPKVELVPIAFDSELNTDDEKPLDVNTDDIKNENDFPSIEPIDIDNLVGESEESLNELNELDANTNIQESEPIVDNNEVLNSDINNRVEFVSGSKDDVRLDNNVSNMEPVIDTVENMPILDDNTNIQESEPVIENNEVLDSGVNNVVDFSEEPQEDIVNSEINIDSNETLDVNAEENALVLDNDINVQESEPVVDNSEVLDSGVNNIVDFSTESQEDVVNSEINIENNGVLDVNTEENMPVLDNNIQNTDTVSAENINDNLTAEQSIGNQVTSDVVVPEISTSNDNLVDATNSVQDNNEEVVEEEPVMPEKVVLEGNTTFNNQMNNNQTNSFDLSTAIYYDVATNCFIDANGNQYYDNNSNTINMDSFNNTTNNTGDYDNSYKVRIVKEKPSLLRMMVNILSYALFIILLIFGLILLFYFVDQKVRESKGDTTPSKYNAYVVLTGSMVPTININDVVITKYEDPKNLKKDDIITFYSDYYNLNVTHRIIDVFYDDTTNEYMFKTRGDANNSDDFSLLDGSHVYGKVFIRIPKLGYVQNFLAKDGGWIIVILVPCLAILSYDIMKLFKMAGNKSKVLK